MQGKPLTCTDAFHKNNHWINIPFAQLFSRSLTPNDLIFLLKSYLADKIDLVDGICLKTEPHKLYLNQQILCE